MGDRDLWLAVQLVELAEVADANHTESDCVQQATAILAELLIPAEIAFLLTRADGSTTAAAASTRRARDLAVLETASREGPATDCIAAGQPVLNERVVNAAGRWPAFASAARAAGFALVSAFPMRRREQAIGAISVFSPRAGLEVGEADRVGVFARAVAIAISRQREIQRSVLAATQLQHALDSRVVVEQAKGAIAARLGLTPDAAFELMRRYARRASRPLSEVAGQAIRGELAVPDLVASRLESRSRPAQRMPARQSP